MSGLPEHPIAGCMFRKRASSGWFVHPVGSGKVLGWVIHDRHGWLAYGRTGTKPEGVELGAGRFVSRKAAAEQILAWHNRRHITTARSQPHMTENSRPHDITSLAVATGVPVATVADAVQRLITNLGAPRIIAKYDPLINNHVLTRNAVGMISVELIAYKLTAAGTRIVDLAAETGAPVSVIVTMVDALVAEHGAEHVIARPADRSEQRVLTNSAAQLVTVEITGHQRYADPELQPRQSPQIQVTPELRELVDDTLRSPSPVVPAAQRRMAELIAEQLKTGGTR